MLLVQSTRRFSPTNSSVRTAGGYDTNYNHTLNLAQRLDPNTNSWVSIPSMPTPRGDVMCAALNGEFVVAGGYCDPTNMFKPASFRTEVEAYNPATGKTLPPPPPSYICNCWPPFLSSILAIHPRCSCMWKFWKRNCLTIPVHPLRIM